MAETQMFVEERKMKIVEYIEEHRKATVLELRERFNVSSATIRNDLRDLESVNLLLRTHGGAMMKSKTGLEFDSSQKEVLNLPEKKRIAGAALELVEDNDTIILDSGTTILEFARLLKEKRRLTVVTNDLTIALAIENIYDINIVFVGGTLRKGFHCTALTGHERSQILTGLTVDKAFMGANSLSIAKGATTPDINTAETKRTMISIAASVFVLCDSTKFERNSFAQFAALDEIDVVVTDTCREMLCKKFEEHGVRVIVSDR